MKKIDQKLRNEARKWSKIGHKSLWNIENWVIGAENWSEIMILKKYKLKIAPLTTLISNEN